MKKQSSNKYHLHVQRPHLVLLGAGASRATFPKGEKNGLIPPLMEDFSDIVDGLSDCLKKYGIEYQGRNFEDVYSSMYEASKYNKIRVDVEEIVYNYFARMELPDEPTLYDHLILSLTGRDAIATFNWDPFIWQAMCRNYKRVGGNNNLPHLIYLHGNTAVGVCVKHEKIQIGPKWGVCSRCGERRENAKLFFPIKQKDYNDDPFIKSGWHDVKWFLQDAFMFTIFGYGAPSSDIEAIRLLQEGWGDRYQRSMEEIEVIDILEEDILCERWDKFIHSHHYSTHKDFYSSSIAKFGRRSCDAQFDRVVNCIPLEEHSIPRHASWGEFDEWLKPLLEEEKAKEKDNEYGIKK